MWVVRRTDQGGGWVTLPGSRHSYTKNLMDARIWATYESARAACCENEVPQNVDELLAPNWVRSYR